MPGYEKLYAESKRRGDSFKTQHGEKRRVNSVLLAWISLTERGSERKELRAGELRDGHCNERVD